MTQTTDTETRSPFEANRGALSELPPSAKLVAKVLEQSEPMAQEHLAEETLLPDRTVRYAIKRLDDAGLIESRHDVSDARRQLYTLVEAE